MSRVAIHMAGADPVDRDAICAVFREVQQSGGRVVLLTHDDSEGAETLQQLLGRLGDEYDQLFSLVGDDLYEWVPESDDAPHFVTGTVH